MSKQRIDEMKKFMQIAEGNVAEAKVDPKLRKAGKILMQVVDGLEREYEELMNGADGDEEEIEFAEHVAEDAEDYKKIVNMLMKGQGKQAARFYDGLDTVSREFVYDHAYSDIEFLQKVFGDLGSDWLFLEYDDEYDESVNEEVCEKCGREGCECGPDCDCEPLEESTLFELGLVGAFLGFVIAKGWPKVRWYLEKKQVKDVLADFERNVSSAALEKYKADFEAKLKSTSPRSRDALMRKIARVEKVLDRLADFADNVDKIGNDKDYMPAAARVLIRHDLSDAMREVEKFVRQSNTGVDRRKAAKRRVAKEDKDIDGMGYYNVTISIDGEYPDEVETAVDYDTAVAAAKDVAEAWKKGRWQMQTWNKGDAKEWHVRGDDGRMEEWFVVIRVEPTDDADVEAWHGESIELGKLAESVLEDSYADYVDWEDEADEESQEQFKLPMGMELVDEDDDPDENDDGIIDDDDIDRMIDIGDDEDYEYNDDLDLDNLGFSIDLDDEY